MYVAEGGDGLVAVTLRPNAPEALPILNPPMECGGLYSSFPEPVMSPKWRAQLPQFA